jgi:putative hydrolase of the HAD superfamily
MKIKSILFSIENTLYDAFLQRESARLNAIKAMIEAGLPIDLERGYTLLKEIVKEFGSNYSKHFDELLKRQGLKWNPKVIAAGVVAYRHANLGFLRPYPDTITTLLKLRDMGYKLGLVSEGIPVKQWQKLIQLGLQHFFQQVIITEKLTEATMTTPFNTILKELKTKPNEAIFVGTISNHEILGAKKTGLLTIELLSGKSEIGILKSTKVAPEYKIHKISDLFVILDDLKNKKT